MEAEEEEGGGRGRGDEGGVGRKRAMFRGIWVVKAGPPPCLACVETPAP